MVLQKIRTIELDGKTIKLQIVRNFSHTNLILLWFYLYIQNHYNNMRTFKFCHVVGYCWTGAVPNYHLQLLQRCTWNHRCVWLHRSWILQQCKTVVGRNRSIRMRECEQTSGRKQMWFDIQKSCQLSKCQGSPYFFLQPSPSRTGFSLIVTISQ